MTAFVAVAIVPETVTAIVAVAIVAETVTVIVSVEILPDGVASKQRTHHAASDAQIIPSINGLGSLPDVIRL